MKKTKLIIWGGFWEKRTSELTIDELNSHASVTCYFLTKELSKEFTVIQIPGFYSIEKAIEHPEAIAILSTFQGGFTKLKEKDASLFHKIKSNFPNKLCSIIDDVSFQSYQEDILFTVLPIQFGFKHYIKRFKSGAEIWNMGWCAASESCKPNMKNEKLKIFLDHGNYAGNDFSHLFIDALNQLSSSEKEKIEVYYQGNKGIERWPLGQCWHNEVYNRAAKVLWIDIQSAYSDTNIFCVTHRESAGLGVIEAAMSGAHIFIPYDKTPFIRQELIDKNISHTKVKLNTDSILRAFRKLISNPHNRTEQHDKLKNSHSWSKAAQNISHILMQKRNPISKVA